MIGFLLSYLTNQALQPVVSPPFKGLTLMVTNLIFPYLAVTMLLQTKDKFRFIIPYIEFAKEVRGGRPYVLDTSAIIDGRIADVIETKIIDSPLIVPSFVLQELQDIADSNDKLRRNRGRRGLDVLSKLQSNPHIEVKLHEVKQDETKGMSVDQRLVELAKKLGGCVVTNDFNLNKVASVQGVDVINLNDLANSLKPRYLPGERLSIKIIKPGEERRTGSRLPRRRHDGRLRRRRFDDRQGVGRRRQERPAIERRPNDLRPLADRRRPVKEVERSTGGQAHLCDSRDHFGLC